MSKRKVVCSLDYCFYKIVYVLRDLQVKMLKTAITWKTFKNKNSRKLTRVKVVLKNYRLCMEVI